MGTSIVRLVLSGYYGFRNSGDEAVLQSILLALQEQGKQQNILFVPVVLSGNPAETQRMYGVEAAHRFRPQEIWKAISTSDGLISGGGSLLQDETSWKTIPYYLAVIQLAKWLKKPTFIYSQGIGPVNHTSFHSWIRRSFKRCALISVRDEESSDLLQRMGINGEWIRVVPDPVMGLQPAEGAMPHSDGHHKTVGVSVRFWNKDRSDLNAIAASLRQLLDETDALLRFLPFHLPEDEEASAYVCHLLGEAYLHRITTASAIVHPQEMLKQVGMCRMLVGMRLHSLIYAAGQYIPIVGVSYDPKIDQFLNRLQLFAATNTKKPEADKLADHLLQVYAEAGNWKERHAPIIDTLKSQAQLPAQWISSYYAKGGIS